MERMRLAVDLHCMAVDDADAGTQMLQNLQGQRHIGDLGDIFDPADPVHQQSGGNDGNGGVFGAADLYFTKQGMIHPVQYTLSKSDTLSSKGAFFCGGTCNFYETVCPARAASYPLKTCETGEIFRMGKLTHPNYTISPRKMQTLPASRTGSASKFV